MGTCSCCHRNQVSPACDVISMSSVCETLDSEPRHSTTLSSTSKVHHVMCGGEGWGSGGGGGGSGEEEEGQEEAEVQAGGGITRLYYRRHCEQHQATSSRPEGVRVGGQAAHKGFYMDCGVGDRRTRHGSCTSESSKDTGYMSNSALPASNSTLPTSNTYIQRADILYGGSFEDDDVFLDDTEQSLRRNSLTKYPDAALRKPVPSLITKTQRKNCTRKDTPAYRPKMAANSCDSKGSRRTGVHHEAVPYVVEEEEEEEEEEIANVQASLNNQLDLDPQPPTTSNITTEHYKSVATNIFSRVKNVIEQPLNFTSSFFGWKWSQSGSSTQNVDQSKNPTANVSQSKTSTQTDQSKSLSQSVPQSKSSKVVKQNVDQSKTSTQSVSQSKSSTQSVDQSSVHYTTKEHSLELQEVGELTPHPGEGSSQTNHTKPVIQPFKKRFVRKDTPAFFPKIAPEKGTKLPASFLPDTSITENEAESTISTNQRAAMATTAGQQPASVLNNQETGEVCEAGGGNTTVTTLNTPVTSSNNSGCSKDTREVRFAANNCPPNKSPCSHPKNKVLKRKNTPATLPKVDKIYAREQSSTMSSFAEEGTAEEEEGTAEEEEGRGLGSGREGLDMAMGGVM